MRQLKEVRGESELKNQRYKQMERKSRKREGIRNTGETDRGWNILVLLSMLW